MKKKTDYSNPVLERLFEFIEQKGGVQQVAESIKKPAPTIYSYRRGVMPGLDVIICIKDSYDDFDLNWFLTGQKTENNDFLGERNRLRRENQLLQMALESKGVVLGKFEASKLLPVGILADTLFGMSLSPTLGHGVVQKMA